MSFIETQVLYILNELYPSNPFKQVFTQHYILYKGKRLYFDFFIKKLGIFVEVQGKQHEEFNKHFHGDKEGFLNHKNRDNLKLEYVQYNDFYLVYINYNDKINKSLVLRRILGALDSKTRCSGRLIKGD